MRKFALLVITPLLLTVLIFLASYYIYPQIPLIITYKLITFNRLNVSAEVVPEKHLISNIPNKLGKKYSYERVSFVTDWLEKDIILGESSKIIEFKDESVVIINGSERSLNIYDTLSQELRKKTTPENARTYLANSEIYSNKGAYEYMLYVTPSDVSISNSMDKLTLNTVLIIMKSSLLLNTNEVLKYELGGLVFYQYSPLGNGDVYDIIFFDKNDDQHSITIVKEDISQTEIESIVKTIEISDFQT